ncbi:hypothetical protein K402DRAFT_401593 [Aulographum hederae CBS 113979]|uniref:Uncharacterized protein n=1 Tax=Aulographum hederae CBS 113979 TaxID=1176131 RepID=A0A6G1HAQ7_9PEZI|nr:hypothetical protein K402DRAFT_401593 [Aulographum hederae CBS 113979]
MQLGKIRQSPLLLIGRIYGHFPKTGYSPGTGHFSRAGCLLFEDGAVAQQRLEFGRELPLFQENRPLGKPRKYHCFSLEGPTDTFRGPRVGSSRESIATFRAPARGAGATFREPTHGAGPNKSGNLGSKGKFSGARPLFEDIPPLSKYQRAARGPAASEVWTPKLIFLDDGQLGKLRYYSERGRGLLIGWFGWQNRVLRIQAVGIAG